MSEKVTDFADRLQTALDNKGWRAVDLCRETDTPKSMLSFYLSGKAEPRADRLHVIAQALEVSEPWLLGYDEPQAAPSEAPESAPLEWAINRNREFGERIKARRDELKLTQAELAARMGYTSKSTINKIELGINDIPLSRLAQFAQILGVSEPWLLGYDEPKPQQNNETTGGDRMNARFTIELCAEDRARIDRLIDELEWYNAPSVKRGTPAPAPKAEPKPEVKPAPVAEPPKPEPVPVKEETPAPATVTLAQIQQKVIQLAASANGGKKAAVRDIVQAYARRVSDLPADKWVEVWDKLNALEKE